jgi:hypothetical protein
MFVKHMYHSYFKTRKQHFGREQLPHFALASSVAMEFSICS